MTPNTPILSLKTDAQMSAQDRATAHSVIRFRAS
jgi:hypothetical protein